MPYIHVNIKQKINNDEVLRIKEGMGKAIEKIATKKESQLMVQITDNCTMFNHGEDLEQIAYVHMKAFKQASLKDNTAFTKADIMVLVDVLNIPKENIYLNITEYDHWGANGNLI